MPGGRLSTSIRWVYCDPHNMRNKPRRLPRIPKGRRFDVSREEFNHVIDLLNKRGEVVDEMRRELDIQFKRIAQLQLDVDRLRERQ